MKWSRSARRVYDCGPGTTSSLDGIMTVEILYANVGIASGRFPDIIRKQYCAK